MKIPDANKIFFKDFAGLNFLYKNKGKYSLKQSKMILIVRMTKMKIEIIR